MKTAPERKTAAARAVCAALSAVSSRTRTLVSTATTPRLHALGDRPFHVRARTRRPAIAGVTDDVFQASGRKRPDRAEQDTFWHPLDDERCLPSKRRLRGLLSAKPAGPWKKAGSYLFVAVVSLERLVRPRGQLAFSRRCEFIRTGRPSNAAPE
jgi:hypothetical protein